MYVFSQVALLLSQTNIHIAQDNQDRCDEYNENEEALHRTGREKAVDCQMAFSSESLPFSYTSVRMTHPFFLQS